MRPCGGAGPRGSERQGAGAADTGEELARAGGHSGDDGCSCLGWVGDRGRCRARGHHAPVTALATARGGAAEGGRASGGAPPWPLLVSGSEDGTVLAWPDAALSAPRVLVPAACARRSGSPAAGRRVEALALGPDLSQARARTLALACGCHPRLGAASPLSVPPSPRALARAL